METTHPDREAKMSNYGDAVKALGFLFLLGVSVSAVEAQTMSDIVNTKSDIVNTKHNLSVSGRGSVRALTETRICIFCHTPHNATPHSPLWNKELEPRAYTMYTSPTLKVGPLAQPSGPTKLCLSCHDGTIAMGAVVNPSGGISIAGSDRLPPGSLSNFGLDLSGHHPVSFAYHNALPNAELASSPPADLAYGGTDEVHCITCHDPHKDVYGKFLLKDNRYSALCTSCHQMTGWNTSAHANSTASVVGILPRPPKTWPNYTQLNEWGCEVCHTPHFAPTAEELLNFTAAPPAPFSCTSTGCHTSGSVPPNAHAATAGVAAGRVGANTRAIAGGVDIARQTRKVSAHHEPLGVIPMAARVPGGAARSGIRSVACADCHNPHLTSSWKAEAPYASGLLKGVTGVDRNGAGVRSATYEYEVCFKCHSDNTPDLNYVPRVLVTTNLRLAFDTANPSYHPVLSLGRNLDIPSIPSPFEPTMTPSVIIYCTTCHADDEGASNGPHGSSFAPILKERYETTDNTPESYDNYALCYRCHNRSSILGDASFRKKVSRKTATGGGHSGHLAAGAPCSACHDAHGVNSFGTAGMAGSGSSPGAGLPPAQQIVTGVIASSGTGDHTHLINFDTRIVQPNKGKSPFFTDNMKTRGPFSGSCNLVCHGVVHDSAPSTSPGVVNSVYP